MPTRRRGRFITAVEKQRREWSSNRMTELNKTHGPPPISCASVSTDSVLFENRNADLATPDETTDNFVLPTCTIPSWRQGRRIVELDRLADQLRSCIDCGQPLQLHRIQTEVRRGLGSMLYVQCVCGVSNTITTSKTHKTAKRGMPTFDVNTKAALGMFHTGMGHRQFTQLLSTLEIRGLHHTSMKTREIEISQHIHTVAQESCNDALRAEASASCNRKTSIVADGNVDGSLNDTGTLNERSQGEFKYDMGWQKRGSRRAYDSKPGVGTMIGNNTGQVCAYGVRVSDCRMCQVYGNKGEVPPDHTCRKNWNGSAKAMEPDVGGTLVKEIEGKGVDVGVIIMDDDTTTMARLRKDLSHSIVKWSDINHTAKHLTNSLYSLQKKHRVLTTPTIQYLKKCFNYALAQNKGDVENCRSAILQIVPHAFGEHASCGTWCGYNQNPETYKHRSLTRDFSGEILHRDLDAVFLVFANNAEKIAPGGSTKDVESFNNMAAAKAPKRCHFSASGSLNSRVDCAVVQKNIGHTYINKVNKAAGLSPGIVYKENAVRKDTERKRQLAYTNNREVKKRKIENKLKKRNSNCAKEVREGITYKSSVATTHHADIVEIPSAVSISAVENVADCLYQKVFCDIETTSLQQDADIIQISAICGTDSFDQYITPTKSVSPGAAAVTGLTSQGGVLFYHGTPVPTLPLQGAMQQFLAWLDDRAPVILIGHNFRAFDFPRIIRVVDRVKMNVAFKERVVGAVDTLPLFKEVFPGRDTYKQEALVHAVLKENYEAHNALADVSCLQKLYTMSDISDTVFFNHSFTTSWGFSMLAYQQNTEKNVDSMQDLVNRKVISKAMAQKIAASGLQLCHLRLAFSRGGLDGLTHLLSEKVNGKVRVTSTKRVISNLAKELEK
ncbi:hypothetical protein ScPMuIL_011458 [Solemya velum]